MVRVYAPALSIDASGSLAGAMVFSKWKGRNYVRSHVNPAQPRTGPQVGVRAMFKFLAQTWTTIASVDQATWDARAKEAAVSSFNAMMSYNQARWRNFLTPSQAFPATEASAAPSACTGVATVGIRQLSLAITHGAVICDNGIAIFRAAAAPTPAFSNCIAVIDATAGGDGLYVDTPLDPGTYHYKTIAFNTDGKQGAASADFSGTVV